VTAPEAAVPFAAVLVMAGAGVRLRSRVPKAFVPLDGAPMWVHAARTFAGVPGCRGLVLVAPRDRVGEVRAAMPEAAVVAGGARRQDSVRHGLAAVPDGAEVVAVHDAARPLVRAQTIAAAVREAARCGASLVAVPVRDTIKRVADGRVVETLDREGLWQAQTPQCFRLDLILGAHRAAEREGWEVTDDCALAERLGAAVSVVRGDAWNLKVTDPDDLAAAQALLALRRESGKETT
jgi:2-C-methyl-D-erythritol 4-phosphate cytidylyltransferase